MRQPAWHRARLRCAIKADGPRFAIPSDQWKLNGDRIEFAAGFEPGRLYDFVYTAKDPAVAGLGMAAVRDYVSYIKQRGEVKRAIGAGISQSGRFLRSFLADGFNGDEQGKKVFDGVWAHVAGGGHGDFNQRFAQAGPHQRPVQRRRFSRRICLRFTPDELLAKSVKAGSRAEADAEQRIARVLGSRGRAESHQRGRQARCRSLR